MAYQKDDVPGSYGHGGDHDTYKGFLDFSANINPFGPSLAVRRGAYRGEEEMGRYPDWQCRSLREGLARRLQLPESCLVFGNGGAELIYLAALAARPKRALLTIPSFSEYRQALEAAGCELKEYVLTEETQFTLGEDYLDALTEEVDMAFLCSPDNPTGRIISRPLLKKILQVCGRRDIRLVLDECFYQFVREEAQSGAERLVERNPQLFVLRAFTKMYGMPGLRLGYGICSDRAYMERISRIRQPWSVSTPAMEAGLAALSENEASRAERVRDYLILARREMERQLDALGICYIPSEANYILFRSSYDLFERLLEYRILIRDCKNYRGLGKGYYRTAVRTREENARLIAALREIYGESRTKKER